MGSWIDLRDDLAALIHGDAITRPQGYWAVLRIMRLGQRSRFWHEERQEAIGGPPWNYDDAIVRVISQPGASAESQSGKKGEVPIAEAGLDSVAVTTFAVEWNPRIPRMPGEHDYIYEIAEAAGAAPPRPPLHVTSRYRVIRAIPVRGDYGRIEVLFLACVRVHGEN